MIIITTRRGNVVRKSIAWSNLLAVHISTCMGVIAHLMRYVGL